MYSLAIRPNLEKLLKKLAKKSRSEAESIMKKTEEILENPHHYKNLRAPLNRWKRVHIHGSFVLVYSIDEKTKTVILETYKHHDEVYKSS